MKHVVLLGDSIFDNAPYVLAGETVTDLLKIQCVNAEITLKAVDGHTTRGASQQLQDLPHSATHLVMSIGGNDALQNISVLQAEAQTVAQALTVFSGVLAEFRQRYCLVVETMLAKAHQLQCEAVALCTIYHDVPSLGEVERTALAMFNEVILDVAMQYKVDVIDLRQICGHAEDYSSVSPIEPSKQGGLKIAKAIDTLFFNKAALENQPQIYVG